MSLVGNTVMVFQVKKFLKTLVKWGKMESSKTSFWWLCRRIRSFILHCFL